MQHIDVRAVRHAYELREQESQSVAIGSAALAIVCMGYAGVIGGLVWYACAMGSLLLERLVYQKVIDTEDTSSDSEWRLGLTTALVVIAYMLAGVIMCLDGRAWSVVGGVSMTFICLMNSGHFGKISPRVGLCARAPTLVIAIIVPLLTAAVTTPHYWLGASLMTGLSGVGMALIMRHLAAKDQVEADLAAALAEAKRQGEAAREQEYLVRMVLEQEQRSIAMLDRDMRLIMVNQQWTADLGVDADALIGRSFYDVIPQTPAHWREAFERALTGEHVRNERDLIPQPDKSIRCWRWEVKPWRDAQGEIGGVLTFGENITHYYLAEREAEEATQILRLALSAASAAVWRLDFAKRTIWTSPEYAQIFGEVPTFRDFASTRPSWLLEADYERYAEMVKSLSKPGARAMIDHRLKTTDESEVWVHSVMEAIPDETGAVRWVVGMTHNVSERKAMEARLLQATRQTETALAGKRSMFDAIMRDLDSAIPVDETPAPSALDHEPRDSRIDFAELFERFVRVLGEIDLRDAALLEAVKALRNAREAADAANVAKSQFLANMSHELRTPLNAIIGFSEILAEDAERSGDRAALSDLSRIRGAGKSLLALINSILDLSKIEAGAMDLSIGEFDIAQSVREAVEIVAPMAETNNAVLESALADDLGVGVSDPFKISQCLLNLLSNAAKFTRNGRIRLSATRRRERDGDWLVFAVADTGIGMTGEQLSRLFQPFAQADPSITRQYGGTGLGLSITRRLAEMLGGSLAVQSVFGQGSTFTLTVPAVLRPAALDADQNGPNQAQGPLVLVVDDEPDALQLARRTLDRLGFRFLGAASAQEGLRLARERQPVLIVLDIQLPDRTGWEVLSELRDEEATRAIPALVVSISDDRARAIAMGACQHLVKPVERDVFAAAIVQYARAPRDEKALEALAAPSLDAAGEAAA